MSWGSPEMRAIEKDWVSVRDACGMTRDKGLTCRIEVDKLFASRFSKRDVRHLAASCDVLPLQIDHRNFTGNVLAFIITSFVDSGDRSALVKLLATRCPSRVVEGATIEGFLCAWGGLPQASYFKFCCNRLNDPILVLGEAYAMSRVPETRRQLAAAVRRGFADIPVHGKGDAEYVANAMRWYEQGKDHLEHDPSYVLNELGSFNVERYEREPDLYEKPRGSERQPLFVTTPSPAWLRQARRVVFLILLLYVFPVAVAVVTFIGLWRRARRKGRKAITPEEGGGAGGKRRAKPAGSSG